MGRKKATLSLCARMFLTVLGRKEGRVISSKRIAVRQADEHPWTAGRQEYLAYIERLARTSIRKTGRCLAAVRYDAMETERLCGEKKSKGYFCAQIPWGGNDGGVSH